MLVIFFETKKRSIFKTFRKRFRVAAALSGSRKTEFIEFPTLKILIAKKSCRSPRKFAPAKKLLEFPPRKISRGDI